MPFDLGIGLCIQNDPWCSSVNTPPVITSSLKPPWKMEGLKHPRMPIVLATLFPPRVIPCKSKGCRFCILWHTAGMGHSLVHYLCSWIFVLCDYFFLPLKIIWSHIKATKIPLLLQTRFSRFITYLPHTVLFWDFEIGFIYYTVYKIKLF